MKALVVDDSRAVRLILSQILNDLGFEVSEANNGKEALEKLSQPSAAFIRVAMVDWNMPEMTGLELLRHLRADAKFNPMRVVMVTTENDVNSIVQALQAGADEYVMKPFTREVIQTKLHLLGVMP